jgi:hypothetical protein
MDSNTYWAVDYERIHVDDISGGKLRIMSMITDLYWEIEVIS